MKGVFVILDGIGDEPCQALGQKTPLEAAKTPNLDAFAKKSKIDRCITVKEGYTPESHEGVLSLLGYESKIDCRGALEALGLGIKLKNGDLALRCNFATVDDLHNLNILDRRAGRTLTTKEARQLAENLNKKITTQFKTEFYPSVQHRGVLVMRGGFSNNFSDVDVDSRGKLAFSEPLDEEEDSKLSSEFVNSYIRHSFNLLDNHPINIARAKKGLYSANILLARGASNEVPKFKKLKGKWMALGYMPLEIGIAKATGMDLFTFKYPEMKDMDVYRNIYDGLNLAVKNAIEMLKKYKNKYDYFYIHFKETDLPGHDNKPLDKIKMIEHIDKEFFGFLHGFIGESRLIVTGDHATACRRKSHTADAVPLLRYPSPAVKEQRFTESSAAEGNVVLGKKVLERGMFLH
jgi:2,3-bisphosphoglycerate-independent phosphoglycerate mutase